MESERKRAAQPVSAEQFKLGMRSLAGAVTLICSGAGGRRYGMAATAVCSVSAEPATLLVCVNRASATHGAIARSRAYAVNVLRAEDRELSGSFSGAQSGEARFRSREWTRLATGAPVLVGALAAFDCRVVKRFTCGTHSVFLGEVVQVVFGKKGRPLLYADGQYARLAPLQHDASADVVDWWGA